MGKHLARALARSMQPHPLPLRHPLAVPSDDPSVWAVVIILLVTAGIEHWAAQSALEALALLIFLTRTHRRV